MISSSAMRVCLLLSAAWSAPALAQTADGVVVEGQPNGEGAAEDKRGALEAASDNPIVVTASRRPQQLQDTALAVTAVSAERLDAANITDTASLQTTVPALNYATGAGASFIYLRGVGSNVFGTFSDNSVATYVDGIYIPRNTAAIQELFDVERVEVLRGPQATLYGRNATGGAVLITTAAPTDYFTAAGDLQIASYDTRRVRAMLSGPLMDGLSARISAVSNTHDGYSTDLASGERYDDKEFWALRGTLLADPLPDLSITLTGHYSKEDGAPGATKAVDPNSLPFRPRPFGAGTPFSADPRASYHSLANRNPSESYGGNLRVAWDTVMGRLQSNAAYNRYKLGPTVLDIDDSLAPLLEYRGQLGDTAFFYQDLILTSNPSSGPFEWLAGATYAHEDTATFLPVVTPGGLSSTDAATEIHSYAAYAELGYKLTDRLKLVAGLRYSSEERSGHATQVSGGRSVTLSNRKTWTDWSPKASVEFRPADDILVYASATKGFKSGAFDPINVASAANPETLWNYEVGLRSQFLDRRLTLNATAFHYDYKDLQIFNGFVQGSFVATFLQNAGGANVDGFEIETSFAITPGIRVGGTLSLLDARYTDGTILADLANARPGAPGVPAVVSSFDVGGNRLVQAPELTGTAYLEVSVPLGPLGRLQFYGDYFHQSERFFSAFEDPTLRAAPYDTINLRATYFFPGDHLYVAGFVRNADDTLVRSQISRAPPFGTLETYAPPRLTGFELGMRF